MHEQEAHEEHTRRANADHLLHAKIALEDLRMQQSAGLVIAQTHAEGSPATDSTSKVGSHEQMSFFA